MNGILSIINLHNEICGFWNALRYPLQHRRRVYVRFKKSLQIETKSNMIQKKRKAITKVKHDLVSRNAHHNLLSNFKVYRENNTKKN